MREPTQQRSSVGSRQALQESRLRAREWYEVVAAALKDEARIVEHIEHKKISGLAWTGTGRILGPAGVTKRQLYVLAHECGHIVLHSNPPGRLKPSHVMEHEAETYAHRAFNRYGLEVPDKSAEWARGYVAQCIRKDRALGIPICPMAEAFSTWQRSPLEPLPGVDGYPLRDLSRPHAIEVISEIEAIGSGTKERAMVHNPDNLPIACGTCRFRYELQCNAHLNYHSRAWSDPSMCNFGHSWRPKRYPFWRLYQALLDRISGRHRLIKAENAGELSSSHQSNVARIEDHSRKRS